MESNDISIFLIYAEEAHWSHLSPEYQLSIRKKIFRDITKRLNNIFETMDGVFIKITIFDL